MASTAVAAPQLTDQTISDKVEDELVLDPGVISTKVDVTTSDGVVTLTGQAANVLAKDRAARVAQAVKGVTAVVNRIDVEPPAYRSDEAIRKDVEAALAADPAADSYELTVAVEDGEVTLTGTVDSYQEQQLAKKVAKGVRGVLAVEDSIDVDLKTERPDSEIKPEVEKALRWDAYVDDYAINVSVDNGEVALSGIVGSASEKRLAAAAAWVAGVESVDTSKLTVENWARDKKLRGDKYVAKSAGELESAVKAALLRDPRVMSFNVTVDATGSLVTLRGTVDNLKAKRAAGMDARNTVGVTSVDNRLKVRLTDLPSDADIAADIRDALRRDPYLERYEVTVTVVDNTAYLYGSVDSYFEKNRADDVASRIDGVYDVKNRLKVDYTGTYIYDPYIDEDEYVDDDEVIDYERRSPTQTDAQLKADIESELWWSPFIDSDDVTVTVDNGVASLTGTVGSRSERKAATENAYEGGATLVDNDIVITNQ